MLWWLALIPLLTGVGIYVGGEARRYRLAVIAGVALTATLLWAVLGAAMDWRSMLAWNDLLGLSTVLTPVSSVLAVLVPLVALPVILYAVGQEPRSGLPRLTGLLLAFVGAMELLVIADDFLTLLIGWELVGACSWALISHEWRDGSNPPAGLYAFVATRLGDLGLFLAAMAAFAATGSLAFDALGALNGPLQQLFVAGVLVSAAAKSGQMPFAPWLFRAMAGPTPVSALLHAATMVAAGAYLLIRLAPALTAVAWFGPAAVTVGLVTALSGGLVALLQPHAKKLLAASTSAHYGFMFAAVGAGFPGVATLHLIAHALFKAPLFLAAGVAGERSGTFELAHMRCGRGLPVIAVLTAIASLALAGVPPLGGAWTKEAVMAAAGQMNGLAAFAALLAGGLSAAYAARFQFSAFGAGSESRGRFGLPRSLASGAITGLAVATLVLSLLWLPAVQQAISAAWSWRVPEASLWERVGALLAVVVGLYIGWLLAGRYASVGETGEATTMAEWLGLPELIERVVCRPVTALAVWTARLDDQVVDALPRGAAVLGRGLAAIGGRFGECLADALPEGSGRLLGASGADVQRLQTGFSHHYYALVAVVAFVLAGVLIVWS